MNEAMALTWLFSIEEVWYMQYMSTYRALCGACDLQAEVGGKLKFGQTNSVAVDCLFKNTHNESLNNKTLYN